MVSAQIKTPYRITDVAMFVNSLRLLSLSPMGLT